MKFTAQGTVTIAVGMRTAGDRCTLRVAVTDTGMGIDREALDTLFVEFNQLEASMARRFGGTGLGLAICKRLVDMMGGEIGVESVHGQGSRFWFDVPVAIGVPERERSGAIPAQDGQALDVLVVDDNAVNRQLVARILNSLGHVVTLASSGRQAVTAASEHRFDLIFMDIQMPDMDGFAATQAIRGLPGPERDTPIAALTANCGAEDRKACLAAGMDGFASKPVSRAGLQAVATHLCGARHRAGVSPLPSPLPLPLPGPVETDRDASVRDALREAIGEDALRELDVQFSEDLAALAVAIESSFRDGKQADLRAAIHTLRGAASGLGYRRLVEASDRVRRMSAGEDGDDPAAVVQALVDLCRDVADTLAPAAVQTALAISHASERAA